MGQRMTPHDGGAKRRQLRSHTYAGMTPEQRVRLRAELEGVKVDTNRHGGEYEGWSVLRQPTTGVPNVIRLLKRDSMGKLMRVINVWP